MMIDAEVCTGTLAGAVISAAERFPRHCAVEHSEGYLTYQDLLSRARDLGARLCTRRRSPSFRIGLAADGSLGAYVAYLAILIAGGTVVPFDPTLPRRRLDSLMVAAGLEAVVSSSATPGSSVELVGLDLTPETEPIGDSQADLPAYLLFTSGSTGRPKGVPIGQAAAAAYVRQAVRRAEVKEGARLSQNFRLTFDPSVFDLFGAWSTGATLVPPTAKGLSRPSDYVSRSGLTHWFSVPSVVNLAHRTGGLEKDSMPSIVWSGFIGEQLHGRQTRLWRAAAPNSRLSNVYGPTELTVACAEFEVVDQPEADALAIPIGTIYDGMDWVVLGADGRPTEEGELCVRGRQRFDGYLDAGDNVGRFVQVDAAVGRSLDLGSPVTPEHYYRTGDRVVVDGTGCIRLLGRMDRQVKVRGYRLELAEVETVARSHPEVSDAVAVMIGAGGLGERLALAFTTSRGVTVNDVTGLLRDNLPVHAVPDVIRRLGSVPLGPNGKVDHAAVTAMVTA